MFIRTPLRTILISSFALLAAAPVAEAQSDRDLDLFMWVGSSRLMEAEPEMYRSMLAFADRHDIIPYESGAADTVVLRKFLQYTRGLGMEKTWIEVGPGREYSVQEFVENPAAQAAVVARYRNTARVYNRYYPNFGRVTFFDEAPLGGFKAEQVNGRRSYLKDAEQFRRYGPRAFAILYKAFKQEMPAAEVGIFLHHPHNASPEVGGEYSFIADFMREARELGATPDFIYSDVYRGYFRGSGVEATNDYVRDVVSHTKAVAEQYGVEAYQLGQMHTIKIGHTPSRWEIDTNVEAMLDGNPDGIGWYWPNYSATDHLLIAPERRVEPRGYDISFEPFVPNSAGLIHPAGPVFGTSRDRFVYSYLRMLEAAGQIEPRDRFDLWIYGHDFDHVEHDVYIRAPGETEWSYLGGINPQLDASGYKEGADPEFIYSYNDRSHAVVFHALDRKRFLGDGRVQVKIETPRGGDGSTVSAVYAMPYRATRNYVTEADATRMIEEHPRWIQIISLGSHVRPQPRPLRAGEPFTATVEVQGAVDPRGPATEWLRRMGGPAASSD